MSLADHVRWLEDVLDGRRLDTVIVHDGPPPAGAGAPLRPGRGLADRVVASDLLSRDENGEVGRAHDPDRLAAALATVLSVTPTSAASRIP
jgi:hypothetical protein